MRVADQLVHLARLHGLDHGAARVAAMRWLERLGLGDVAARRTERLSLGNQQRAQLGAALVHDPELLVLDEPFSGLDPVGVDMLSEVLLERARAGVPVVFSSHQLELVERLCDAVAIVRAGRVVASGTVAELRAQRAGRRWRIEVAGADGAWLAAVPKATVVAAGPQAQRVAARARAQEKAFDVALTVRTVPDDATARGLVRSGDADVAVLSGARGLAAAQDADDKVIAAVQSGSQAARGGSLPPPLPVARAGDAGVSDRRGIAFVAVVILYGQLLGYGFWVASGVVEEKATRVVELMLSAITPRQLPDRKVVGIGVLGLGQLLLIGVVGALIGAASGQLELTSDVLVAV